MLDVQLLYHPPILSLSLSLTDTFKKDFYFVPKVFSFQRSTNFIRILRSVVRTSSQKGSNLAVLLWLDEKTNVFGVSVKKKNKKRSLYFDATRQRANLRDSYRFYARKKSDKCSSVFIFWIRLINN